MATEPRHRWPQWILHSTVPGFVLSPAKRVRAVNAVWEALTGIPAGDAIGMACLRRGPTDDVFRVMAPPREAKTESTTVRRATPGRNAGPPWWDVSFVPWPQADGSVCYVGQIRVVGGTRPGEKAVIPAAAATIRDRHARSFAIDALGGSTPTLARFAKLLRHAAETAVPVWLVGEPGSGKETAARAIHGASDAKDRAFFGLDCGGSPWFLVESILAGRGSFGESGRLGTLYLKDPHELPPDAQDALLAWLDGPGRRVRVICGSRKIDAVKPEFAAALRVLEIAVPPLRDRMADWQQIVLRSSRPLTAEASALLSNSSWPGNFRELRETIESIPGEGPISPEQLPREFRETLELIDKPPIKPDPGPKLDDVLIQVERRLLKLALETHRGNATKAADWLGIARSRFLNRAKSLGVTPST